MVRETQSVLNDRVTAVLGFSEGSSAALVSLVGRQCALLPSYEMARRELAARGTPLNIKVVHRIARTLGAQVLTTRTRDLERWRAGQLPFKPSHAAECEAGPECAPAVP